MKTPTWMLRLCCTTLVQAAMCLPAYAYDLNGAWATDSGICPKMFSKTPKAVAFKQDSEEWGNGFIVDGNVVRGQGMKCVIKSKKESGAETHVIATCASEIMIDQVRLNFKAVDENTIIRIFSGVGGFDSTYVRCPL